MNDDQIKTAMATAWLKLEILMAEHGHTLSERDRLFWTVGFADGGAVVSRKAVEKHLEALANETPAPTI